MTIFNEIKTYKHISLLFISSVLFCFLFTSLSHAQINADGLPFIKNYTPEEYGAHPQNWAVVRDNRGNMYFCNNHGLLQYDGVKWILNSNTTSAAIRTLATDNAGHMYYGATKDFGIIMPDSLGGLKFFSIYKHYNKSSTPDFTTIWNINIIGKYVYFQSNEKLFKMKVPLKSDKDEDIAQSISVYEPKAKFHWSFAVYDQLYIREVGEGLKIEKNGKLELVEGSEIFANDRVYAMMPYSNGNILIGSRNKGLVVYNPDAKTDAFSELECESSTLIKNGVIYGGFAISNKRYIVYTLQNGLIIFNDQGKILEHLVTGCGISDNSILSAYYDVHDGNLWVTGAVKGIYKVAISSPFRKLDKTNGLEGAVLDITKFNNKIYVATNIGVFVLNQDENNNKFEQLPNLNYETWDFLEFQTEADKKSLLVASSVGLFEINQKGKVHKILDTKFALYDLCKSKLNPLQVFIGADDGFGSVIYNDKTNSWGNFMRNDSVKNPIRHVYEHTDNSIYLGTQLSGVLQLVRFDDNSPLLIDSVQGLPIYGSDYRTYFMDNQLYIASAKGLFVYNKTTNKVSAAKFSEFDFSKHESGVYEMLITKNLKWMSVYTNSDKNKLQTDVWRIVQSEDSTGKKLDRTFANILPNILTQAMYQDSNYVWLGNDKGVYKYNLDTKKDYKTKFNVNISKVSTVVKGKDSTIFKGNFYEIKDNLEYLVLKQPEELKPTLPYKYNQLTFEYSALFFEHEEDNLYSCRLIGLSSEWSEWKKDTKYPVTNLSPGDYKFEVRAKNIYNTVSSVSTYEFSILPPWYMTVWAYIFGIILLFLLVWFIVRLNTRRLKKDKERLEKLVEERTYEITQQNVKLEQQKKEISDHRDEITKQRDHVIAQKDQIEKQHKLILEQTNSIKDSILYASRIQVALLPPEEILSEILPDHFVLFRPRDIVSGDFYWASKRDNQIIIVVADCTGHGVPGAFMSMLGMSFLNDITSRYREIPANEILNKLRESIKKSLRQTGKDNEAKDGMDMSICIFDFHKMEVEFAGAYNSLCVIRDNEISEYKADRMPVGIYIKDDVSFTNYTIEMQNDDRFYMFSDGYPDQFGGPKGSKLMKKHFKRLLLENHQLPALEQKKELELFLDKWVDYVDINGKKYNQIDDILVMGIRV